MPVNLFSWLVAVLLVFAAGAAVFLMSRGPATGSRRWLLALRVLAIGLLAMMVMQPQCQRVAMVAEKPELAVLVDDSRSMKDGAPGATREGTARAWLETPVFHASKPAHDFRYFAIDSKLRDVAPEQLAFEGGESRIGQALLDWSGRWRGETSAGVIVVSDGLDTAGPGEEFPPPGVPCYVLEVEAPGAVKAERVQLWLVEPPRRAQAGAESSARVVLQGWGTGEREVPVELWSDGKKLGERRVAFLEDGGVVETTLPLPPLPPGTWPFEVKVSDEAAAPSARSQSFVLVVRQEGRGVLMLQNTLGFEGKFLRRALATDRNLRLESFTRLKEGTWTKLASEAAGDAPATLDLTSAGLANRAAVVLADVAPDALSFGQWQAMADHVNQGGGLVVMGGPGFLGASDVTPAMAKLLPVQTPAPTRDGKFPVRMTDAGLRHPVFGPLFSTTGSFPSLQSANLAGGVVPGAQVLMEILIDGQAWPLVAVKQSGEGRVAVILTDTLWHWRTGAAGWSGRQSPYDTFWTQLVDWLAPAGAGIQSRGQLELSTDHGFYREGDVVGLRAEWLGRGDPGITTVSCVVTAPGGDARPVTLHAGSWVDADGRQVQGFRADWKAEETGVHAVEATAAGVEGEIRASARFAVATALGERLGEPADTARLKRLAEASGGGYFTLADAEALAAALPKSQKWFERQTTVGIWNHPLAAALLFFALGVEWFLRRRAHLP